MKNTVFPHKFWRPFLDCMPQLFFRPQYVWFPVHLKGHLIPLCYETLVVNWQNWLFTLFHQSRSVLSPNPIRGIILNYELKFQKNIPGKWTTKGVICRHYNDVIMSAIASQITSLTVVYSIVYSDADQRKHQSSASLAFVWGIHRDRWIPRTKGQLRGKCFHLMTSSWSNYRLPQVLLHCYLPLEFFKINIALAAGLISAMFIYEY